MKGKTILVTRKYFNERYGMIHLNTIYVQHPKQMNGVSIMHLVNKQTTHTIIINQKGKINCVKMYLGVE